MLYTKLVLVGTNLFSQLFSSFLNSHAPNNFLTSFSSRLISYERTLPGKVSSNPLAKADPISHAIFA